VGRAQEKKSWWKGKGGARKLPEKNLESKFSGRIRQDGHRKGGGGNSNLQGTSTGSKRSSMGPIVERVKGNRTGHELGFRTSRGGWGRKKSKTQDVCGGTVHL